ncbi:uncharacterized protein N7459_000558 [Penicillium hispanicum]|uniref:uncharacterized protein n=1 Tax=Penicillium hispanicum TaxID=1080232 RepID=UPI002540AB31|nr:uncharacterized protein N7459_000558 [Penicillium hispanicum]KAJ5594350.1 hypothetical protein N7459_000558 [Penicillium hispanicum]
MVPRRRFSRRFFALAAAAALFFLYHLFSLQPEPQPSPYGRTSSNAAPDTTSEPAPYCPPLKGIDDILVVMKTGVTESREKVPVHFQTTLRCVPHYVIYSDFAEEIEGVQIHDAFRTMDPSIVEQVEDFDIYNRISKMGRRGLEQDDFADEANSAIGKPNNPGWRLDKWKFLPMAQEALRYKPDAKWFVFMEADTYVSWPTLLAWLSHYDAREPHYLGTETQIADVIFAHGGSGFMLTNSALQAVSDQYEARREELDEYTDMHWAGDCVLGKVLADAGIDLEFSWPILQNSNLGELDEFTNDLYRQPWCFIAVAFHHLTPAQVAELWSFEQKRWHHVSYSSDLVQRFHRILPLTPPQTNKRILLHSDVFRELLYPTMAGQPTRYSWDNLSGEEQFSVGSFDECRRVCEADETCVQFSFRESKCFTNATPLLGNANPDASSGWLMFRIHHMMTQTGLCRSPDFGV